MKTLKTILPKTVLTLLLAVMISSCSSTDDTVNDFSSLIEKESFSIEIRGTHPSLGAIDSKIEILKELNIGGNQITLKAKEGVGSNDLTIIINFPADKTASGKKESIGIVLYNNDETDIWNVSDQYQLTSLPSISRRASLDYIIEDNGFYNDTRNFSDRIHIEIKDNRLIGTFTNISAKYSNSNNGVKISGTFDADLSRLNQ
jgi:hypothetical protein